MFIFARWLGAITVEEERHAIDAQVKIRTVLQLTALSGLIIYIAVRDYVEGVRRIRIS